MKKQKRERRLVITICTSAIVLSIATIVIFIVLLYSESLSSLQTGLEAQAKEEEMSFHTGESKETEDMTSEEASAEQTEDTERTENTEKIEEPVETIVVQVTTQAPIYLDLIAVGDNLIHKEIDVTVEKKDGSYSFDALYENLYDMISGADLAILNQEVPCAGNQLGIKGFPVFNAPTEVLDASVRLGFDVITLATNHALDMGQKGIDNTLNYLHTNYPEVLTTGTASGWQEYETIPIIEVQGVRIAVLNYTYGTNGIPLPNEYSVNLLTDKEKMAEDIALAKKLADFVIVAPHWGGEYQQKPHSSQRELAEFFADCGVDLVIGTHPHVVQPLEWLMNSDGEEMPVYYSLGNFISAQIASPRILGGIAKVRLEVTEDNQVRVVDADMDFVVTHYTSYDWKFDDFKLYLYRDYTKSLAGAHGIVMWEKDFSYDSLQAIVDKVYPDWK